MKYPLFVNEVLVHEPTQSVGRAEKTYYPVDGMLKGIRIGLHLENGEYKDFPLVELRRAAPDEEARVKPLDLTGRLSQ